MTKNELDLVDVTNSILFYKKVVLTTLTMFLIGGAIVALNTPEKYEGKFFIRSAISAVDQLQVFNWQTEFELLFDEANVQTSWLENAPAPINTLVFNEVTQDGVIFLLDRRKRSVIFSHSRPDALTTVTFRTDRIVNFEILRSYLEKVNEVLTHETAETVQRYLKNIDPEALQLVRLTMHDFLAKVSEGKTLLNISRPEKPTRTSMHPFKILIISALLGGCASLTYVLIMTIWLSRKQLR